MDLLILPPYILDIVAAMLVVYTAAKEVGPVNLSRLLVFLRHELRISTVTKLLHLVILVGALLSFYILLSPFLGATFGLIIFAVSLPVIAGLLVEIAWRFRSWRRGLRIYRDMGRSLGINEDYIKESAKINLKSTLPVALTIPILALAPFQGVLEFYIASALFIARNVVMLGLIRSEANLLMNFDKPLSHLRMPFNMIDIVEGRVDASQLKMGIGKLGELSNYELSSISSCLEIGACEEACPATTVGRPLSPRVLVRKLSLLRRSLGDDADVFSVVSEEELWSCTTCGACTYSCPVGVRHIDIIIDMRRRLVEEGKLDQKKSTLLLNLSQFGNSMGMPNNGRHEWLRELGLRTVEENPGFEYLLWVGCMGSFDNRARQIIASLVDLLRDAGILDKFAILGDMETCCGDPARRLGEESRFQEFVLNNTEVMRKYGVRKIVLICPHGYNTFKNDYPKVDPWMSKVEVYHHTQLIEELLRSGRIKVGELKEVLTIHDPCYLARYNGVTEPQRRIIIRVGKLKETKYSGEGTFCCGAGGANYWYDVPERKRISHERLEQLSSTGAKTIATLCPFCNAMLNDAARIKGVDVKIMDIVEILNNAKQRVN